MLGQFYRFTVDNESCLLNTPNLGYKYNYLRLTNLCFWSPSVLT